MGKRRGVLPIGARQTPPNVEKQEFGDGDKLIWEQMRIPLQAAVDQVAVAAQNMQGVVATLLLGRAGLDPKDGWRVNIEKLRYEKHPVPEEGP